MYAFVCFSLSSDITSKGVGRCFVQYGGGGGGGGGTSNTWQRCLPYEARKLHNFISITNCAEAHVREEYCQTGSQFLKIHTFMHEPPMDLVKVSKCSS